MIRFRTIISLIWLSFAFPLACHALTPFEIHEASSLHQVQKRNKLIVGMEVKFFPFEYADTTGKPIGFDVDLASIAAKELGVELEIKDMEFSGLIPALQGGKIDMIISGMTRTLTRAKAVTFTQPYFVTGLCALISTKRASDVTEINQLNMPGKILAVKLGTTGDIVAGKLFPKAKVNRFKEESACVLEVVSGRADAFLYDQLSISRHYKQNPETTTAILKPFTYEPYAIAIRSGDSDFLNWLNLYLETIKADGRHQELYRKYFSDLQ
ncbi:MAG: transporter substrate-binding domain-containing protein [Syntrophobacteraceae bacterium]